MRLICIPFLFFLFSCAGQPSHRLSKNAKVIQSAHTKKIRFQRVEILIQYPPDSIAIKGDLLLLPGWNFSNTKWCDSTDVCKTALQKGYRVIAPQMGQSIYATHYFSETRADLKKHPTLLWLDSALQYLTDSMKMFQMKKYVLGLSTGARGVALICKLRPGFFDAAAALSGDFDQTTIPNDPLCTLVYGSYTKFSSRWKTVDNPTWSKGEMNTPLYLAYGEKDKVVPGIQTESFFDHLVNTDKFYQTANGDAKNIKLVTVNNAQHNFSFWQSQLGEVWAFFEQP